MKTITMISAGTAAGTAVAVVAAVAAATLGLAGAARGDVLHYGCWGEGDVGYEVVLDTDRAMTAALRVVGGYDMTEADRNQELLRESEDWVFVNREFWFRQVTPVMAEFGMHMFAEEAIACDPALVEGAGGSLMPLE